MNIHSLRQRPLSAITGVWWVAPVAFLATLMALPVSAGILVPDEPLSTGNRVAPNILFILDDSGSMGWRYMYSLDVTQITGPNSFLSKQTGDNTSVDSTYGSTTTDPIGIYDQNYKTNTLYYNPALDYQPWVTSGGGDMTGGTNYASAYSDDDMASGSINLGNNKQVFYVPVDLTNDTPSYVGNVANYWRYEIKASGEGGGIVRGRWGAVTETTSSATGYPKSGLDSNGGWSSDYTFTVPDDAVKLIVSTSGGTHGTNGGANNGGGRGADLYLRRVDRPEYNYAASDCIKTSNDNNETCEINSPVSGTWHVQIYGNSRYRNVNLSVDVVRTNRCVTPGTGKSQDFINCSESVTPTGRSAAEEKSNFAIWYSYHRTRTKVAKAGAGRAFRAQGKRVRVGFRTIHNRSNYDIPVDNADGRFINDYDVSPNITNRETWYSRLYGAQSNSGTPLQTALQSAGQYFSSAAKSGPYGPEAGAAQYSCRQNFTILTTDGFWNSGTVDNGNVDAASGSAIYGPAGKEFTYSPTGPYKDSYAQTLADVAMYYWKNDLRTEASMGGGILTRAKNNVPTSTEDPAFWQHMVTFGISIGLKGNSGYTSVSSVPDSIVWPKVSDAEDADRIDDLLHAAVNGRGRFIAATNPARFASGLTEALAAIQARTSSFSNVATNAASIRTDGKVFNASYVSGVWSGAVKAFNLDSNNRPSSLAWEASIPAVRKVFTFDGVLGTTFPTPAQTTALLRTGDDVDYPVSGTDNAAYIAGDQSLEGDAVGELRERSTVLGDIVGSSPAYVDHTDTLYVSANDGMLHAFNAGTGVELFSYVPNILSMAKLRDLSRGDYTHKFMVDGPIAVSARNLTPGKNLLVGTLGKGGKGMFGLDVSDPDSFAATNVKWELGETPKNNMGLVTGRPILTRVNGSTTPAVIVGNGVNSTKDRAVLLVVNLETGAVIREIDTGAGSAEFPNGLSAPTGVLGKDGRTLAYAYAGDRLGNVWKFDMTNASPASWSVKKLFTAKSGDGTGDVQPITGGITVATDPKTYKRWVFFGTGSFITTGEADDRTAGKDGMYGFIDDDAAVAYADLQKRNINNTGAFQDGYPVRTFDSKASLPTDKMGWFINLPGAGERIVQDSQVVANILVTASMIPEGDACDASGSGYINALDAFTGTSAGESFFDLDGDPDTKTEIGGVPVGSVDFGVGMPTLPIFLDGSLIVGGTSAGAADTPGSGGIVRYRWGQVSWREIRND